VASSERDNDRQLVGFLGVALDGKDGHQRITQSEYFLLLGGSQETHEQMKDTAVRFGEALQRKGKALGDTSVEEAVDLLRESLDP
jgi:hypothetical protein